MNEYEKLIDDHKLSFWFNDLPLAAPTTRSCDKCHEDIRSDDWDAKRNHFNSLCMVIPQRHSAYPFVVDRAAFEKAIGADLQLLIIDLGDSCVVKVEKGVMPHTSTDPMKDLGFYGNLSIVRATFERLRSALDAMTDGEKPPVPRIEKWSGSDAYGLHYYIKTPSEMANQSADVYRFITDDTHTEFWTAEKYQQFSQLAGVELPVWKPRKGEWVCVSDHCCAGNMPVKIWRYTR